MQLITKKYRTTMEMEKTKNSGNSSTEEPKEVNSSSNKSENMPEEKLFDWHLFPKEPIELKSVVEMTVFLLIVCLCGFLYYRWNTIPKRTIDLQFEDLRYRGVSSSDTLGSDADSLRYMYACDIRYCIPMTSHKEFIKDTSSTTVIMEPIFSNVNCSEFIRISFLLDSALNLKGESQYFPNVRPFMKEHNIESEFEKIYHEKIGASVEGSLDSLRERFSDSLHITQDKNLVYCEDKMSLSYFSYKPTIFSYKKKEGEFIASTRVDSSLLITQRLVEPLSIINSITMTSSIEREEHWYECFNIYKPFRGGAPIETPSWGRLEDISQAYYEVNINTNTVDSIVLSMDFVGSTEFSQMDPMPDKMDMSSIVFNDPIKLYKIRANGLRFHARFKELENWQEIRVFSVTAIMSAFVVIFVVFFISSYFKLKKKRIRRNKAIISILKLSILGFLLYHFVSDSIYYLYPVKISIFKINIYTFVILLLFFLLTKSYIKRESLRFCSSIKLKSYIKRLWRNLMGTS